MSRKASWSSLLIAAVFLVFTGCKSAKKTDGADGGMVGGSPTIENAPMTFDAQGSDSGKIQGLETINFEYDRAVLTSDGKRKAQAAADWLKNNPSASLQVEGHCDSRGSIEYNLSLGERRANTVVSYLSGLGVESKRLSPISYGKEKPLAMGDSETDHRKNRRVNFLPLSR